MTPQAPRRPSTRVLHGATAPDDYAWMADHDDPELHAYLSAEREHYEKQTAALASLADGLRGAAVARAGAVVDADLPWTAGGHEFRWGYPPGAEYQALYRREPPDGDWQVVLDLNRLTGPGGHVRLGTCAVSPDGTRLAYSVDPVGIERFTLCLRDLRSGHDVAAIPDTFGECVWSTGSDAVYYVQLDPSNRPWRVLRHDLRDTGTAGRGIFAECDRRFHVQLALSTSGRWIVLTSRSLTSSEVRLVAADRPDRPAGVFRRRQPGVIVTVDHDDRGFCVVSNQDHPEFTVEDGLEPDAGLRVHAASRHAGHLVVRGVRDGRPVVFVHPPGGAPYEVGPDDPAGSLELEGVDATTGALQVAMDSLDGRRTRWRVRLADGDRTELPRPQWNGLDSSEYRTHRLAVTVRDGAQVPVSLVHHASVEPDGRRPCVVRAYGAYETVFSPAADPMLPSLLDRGVVVAIAHVRGGGERGRWWYESGRMLHKRRSFTDLVDVRDELVAGGWAAPGRVACRGMSAGGMLVAGAYMLWPDRWAAVVAEVPAADCLNTMLDADLPLVPNEHEEWGDPRHRSAYAAMRGYVAYENLTDTVRPPLLVTGILKDPRVVIQEPAKWVAALRRIDTRGNRILFRAELGDMPHSGPTGRFARQAYEAEVAAFLLEALGVG